MQTASPSFFHMEAENQWQHKTRCSMTAAQAIPEEEASNNDDDVRKIYYKKWLLRGVSLYAVFVFGYVVGGGSGGISDIIKATATGATAATSRLFLKQTTPVATKKAEETTKKWFWRRLANPKETAETVVEAAKPAFRRFPVLSIMGVYFIFKELWNLVPGWVQRQLLNKRKTTIESTVKDPNDMTDLGNIALKLRSLYNTIFTKLNTDGEKIEVVPALLAILQLQQHIAERGENISEVFERDGQVGSVQDLKGLAEALEYADWAYDEIPDSTLKDELEKNGFSLLRHDKTVLPGYVGHYVALDKEKKLALIGVKGTSSFEDMLTDCCGLAVSHELDGPFVVGGNTEIRCHEGILLASKRLADDLQITVQELLLPRGYDILIVGHSLGAAAASLLGLMLRSRTPRLLRDKGKRMRVLAFASPPVLDYDNAAACTQFCTTIVNNADVIPRASIANLMTGAEIIKSANALLEERGLGYEKNKEALVRKLAEGSKGDPIMEREEYLNMRQNAIDKVEIRDPDHLYVPGKTVIMYDRLKKKSKQEKEEEERTAEGVVLYKDGAAGILRSIYMNDRMIMDHMVDGYRSSFKSLLTPQPTAEAATA